MDGGYGFVHMCIVRESSVMEETRSLLKLKCGFWKQWQCNDSDNVWSDHTDQKRL